MVAFVAGFSTAWLIIWFSGVSIYTLIRWLILGFCDEQKAVGYSHRLSIVIQILISLMNTDLNGMWKLLLVRGEDIYFELSRGRFEKPYDEAIYLR